MMVANQLWQWKMDLQASLKSIKVDPSLQAFGSLFHGSGDTRAGDDTRADHEHQLTIETQRVATRPEETRLQSSQSGTLFSEKSV